MKTIIIALGCVLCVSGILCAQTERKTPENTHDLKVIQSMLRKQLPAAKSATVGVEGQGSGSGVIVSRKGLILTAGHVIGPPGSKLTITFENGKKARGKSLGRAAASDAGMAVIEGPGYWSIVPVAEQDDIGIGEWVFAIGHPGGVDPKRGLVTRLGRVIRNTQNTLQTDCKLLGGDSGGPLFNLKGEVIGINSRISQDLEENFHAHIGAFRRDWERLMRGETLKPKTISVAFLGIGTQSTAAGPKVNAVVPESPAAKVPLTDGDIITHLNGVPIQNKITLTKLLREQLPNSEITIGYLREGIQHSTSITLSSRQMLDDPPR